VTPFGGALGAEVSHVDLREPLSDAQFAVIEQAFVEHLVLVFRNQPLSDEQHLAYARRFGELEGHINKSTRHEKYANVQVFSNVKDDGTTLGYHPERGTLFWHTDKSYVATPSLTTILRSPHIASEGGDTLFANTRAAYDDLDEATRRRIDGLEAVHSWKRSREKTGERPATAEQIAAAPPVSHPIARTHPVTGRKSIYVGSHTSHVVGMDHDEGVELLDDLEKHATQDKYVYRHKWQVDDVLMWDNRATMHCVMPYDAAREKRTIHRVVVKGDKPF
jgi:taurine dioxygenase